MKKTTEIKELTMVCQQGTKSYRLGQSVNSLVIDKIEKTFEDMLENGITVLYTGYTSGSEIVFTAENVPTECEYQPKREST